MESISISDEVIRVADDDDEFDWEAAVKEIDVACEGALTTSTSRTEEVCFVDPVLQVPQIPSKMKKSGGNTRQSTLDRFIQTGDRKSPVDNQSLSHKKRLVDANTEGDSNRGEDTVCYTSIDLEAAKTWIYPVNVPLRDYQLSITKSALFSNTLVALPTGLGKTLIAAVVMYNYFRWFPEGKIVFTAPSRPLVLQQIEACHNIVGIPQEWTIDMTGQLSPSKRACFWKMKRVFFVTPQVLEKDIQSGTCLVKHLVCLVIDEAHRASGNYSYCVVVRELMAIQVQLRILALTATPGSKQQDIQTVIDNLHISKLEYRNESDHDVSQYVHERKLELMEVPMGEDATEIDKLLMNVIDHYVNRLCSCGVSVDNRGSQTLGPCDYLNYREKFRQAPPLSLSQSRYGEVEGAFGVLITLAHIRKLLLSHGIRPAYDMLEGKLQQGNFARALSRNEVIKKAELLMQRNLSHGAQSPKFSKMIEILTDHFKKNDPKSSRVIIFSNFRDSVRDIMDSLSNFRELVKATEFIGQSSGKTLKGQTQKAQQAVLQKFRAGGYNVIVATSIGEEGLDIMEVDLVICFDANVSPLRMIQRMGRTGRKHDGRVVVLACVGSELKGYKRKQASSKAIRKHMHNGGMSSFDFHTSPRMIPHICRPEVQFVEMLIEQFVPRGRKTKDDPSHVPEFTDKMSDVEIELIAKYFQDSIEDKWKPSLIVFPHFQVFPSRVHKVMHSFRTGMLIDTMQSLQGLSFSNANKTLLAEAKITSCQFMEAETIALDDTVQKECNNITDMTCNNASYENLMWNPDSPKAFSEGKVTDIDESVIVASKEKCSMPHFTSQNPPFHCFLFGSDFVSVNTLGMVSITSVPDLLLVKKASPCKRTAENSAVLLDCANPSSVSNSASPGDYGNVLRAQDTGSVTNPAGARFLNHDLILRSRLCNSSDHQEKALHEVEGIILSTPSPKQDFLDSEKNLEIPAISNLLPNGPTGDFKDMGMSPRLTNMVEEGVVPESPIGEVAYCSSPEECMICQCDDGFERGSCGLHPNCNIVQEKEIHVNHSEGLVNLEGKSVPPVHGSPAKLCTGLPPISPSYVKNEQINMNNSVTVGGYVSYSPISEKTHSSFDKIKDSANASGRVSGSPVDQKIRTPLANLTNSSCSKDWCLSSRESSKSVQKAHKFKRLCKYGDNRTENICANLSSSFTCTGDGAKGKQKTSTSIKNFVEDEAEVSSDAEVSEDEEDKDDDSYDDSFIDDRINPTVATTQAEATGNDMMAVYRRSLFSQSPVQSQLNCSTDSSPDSSLPGTKIAVTRSTSGEISHSVQTHQVGLKSVYQSTVKNSQSCQMGAEETSLLATPHENSKPPRQESKTGSRKRKLSFHQGFTTSLQPEQLLQSSSIDKASPLYQCENSKYNGDVFYDDQFFEGLDLDELEAQATKILKCKSDTSIERKQEPPIHSTQANLGLLDSPTFDLGI